MSTLNKKPNMPFAWIPQAILENEGLSFKAKALWLYINSKPTGWHFSKERISKETKEGIRSIRHGLDELTKAGYLRQKRTRDGYIIFDLKTRGNYKNGK